MMLTAAGEGLFGKNDALPRPEQNKPFEGTAFPRSLYRAINTEQEVVS